MRKGIKYLISVCFLLYGVYLAVGTGNAIWASFTAMYKVRQLVALSESADKLYYYISGAYEIIQFLPLLICAVMCICISSRKKNWKYILWSGSLGLSTYVLACIDPLYLMRFNLYYLQDMPKFAIILLCIIGFALYSKKHENSYEPLSILPARWRGQAE